MVNIRRNRFGWFSELNHHGWSFSRAAMTISKAGRRCFLAEHQSSLRDILHAIHGIVSPVLLSRNLNPIHLNHPSLPPSPALPKGDLPHHVSDMIYFHLHSYAKLAGGRSS